MRYRQDKLLKGDQSIDLIWFSFVIVLLLSSWYAMRGSRKFCQGCPGNVFLSSTYFTQDLRTSLEKQLDPRSNCFSRGVLPVFLKKQIATCDFPVGGPEPLSPLWIHRCMHRVTTTRDRSIFKRAALMTFRTFFKKNNIWKTLKSKKFGMFLYCLKTYSGGQ